MYWERYFKSPWRRAGNLKGLISLSLLFVMVSLIDSMMVSVVSSTPDDPPAYVYLTWATPDTAHTINVSWRTDENYAGEVRYDLTSRDGDPNAYSYGVLGMGGVTTPELEGYIHHVGLTGLEPDTIYYFICGNPDHGWSDEHSFRTAPDQRTSFRFATGGDSRDDARYEYIYWPWARDTISKLIAEHDSSFVLFGGDYLWSGEEPGQDYAKDDTWDNWLGAAFKYWRTRDGRLIPLIPVIGNHEVIYPEPQDYDPGTDATNYYTVFNLPGNERWYALSWGPDLRIIVLDSEVLDEDSDTWQEQLEWLESELENSENYLWKVAAFHRPFVTAASSTGEIDFDRRVEDWSYLFTKYGVDLVVTGHVHYYERTCPIDSDPPSPWPGKEAPTPEEGVTYVISGGWGAPLTSAGAPKWFDVYGPYSMYHFCLVNIFENDTLRFQAIDVEGKTFDEFSLRRETRDVEISISPSYRSGEAGATLEYTVTVMNTGAIKDNYDLSLSDTEGWGLSLGQSQVGPLENGVSTNIILEVTIPSDAESCTEDNITVTATSQGNTNVSDSDRCTAHAVVSIGRGVSVSISPWEDTGAPGDAVSFTLTVKNTGEVADNYELTVSDDAGWEATLADSLLTIPAGESQTTIVSIIVPDDAIENESTRITVTATSLTDNTVENSATCTARVSSPKFPWLPVAIVVVIIGAIVAAILVTRPFR